MLRNTYWLLALSLLPTVLGAWIGVPRASPAARRRGADRLPWAAPSASCSPSRRPSTRPLGVPIAAGLHLLHGPDALAPDRHGAGLQERQRSHHDRPFAGTAGVFFVMASLATVIKRDLSGMGKWLFVAPWC